MLGYRTAAFWLKHKFQQGLSTIKDSLPGSHAKLLHQLDKKNDFAMESNPPSGSDDQSPVVDTSLQEQLHHATKNYPKKFAIDLEDFIVKSHNNPLQSPDRLKHTKTHNYTKLITPEQSEELVKSLYLVNSQREKLGKKKPLNLYSLSEKIKVRESRIKKLEEYKENLFKNKTALERQINSYSIYQDMKSYFKSSFTEIRQQAMNDSVHPFQVLLNKYKSELRNDSPLKATLEQEEFKNSNEFEKIQKYFENKLNYKLKLSFVPKQDIHSSKDLLKHSLKGTAFALTSPFSYKLNKHFKIRDIHHATSITNKNELETKRIQLESINNKINTLDHLLQGSYAKETHHLKTIYNHMAPLNISTLQKWSESLKRGTLTRDMYAKTLSNIVTDRIIAEELSPTSTSSNLQTDTDMATQRGLLRLDTTISNESILPNSKFYFNFESSSENSPRSLFNGLHRGQNELQESIYQLPYSKLIRNHTSFYKNMSEEWLDHNDILALQNHALSSLPKGLGDEKFTFISNNLYGDSAEIKTAFEKTFKEPLESFYQTGTKDDKFSVVLNVGNHWVSLTAIKDPNNNDSLHVIYRDSSGSKLPKDIQKILSKTFKQVTVTYSEEVKQRDSYSCGTRAILAMIGDKVLSNKTIVEAMKMPSNQDRMDFLNARIEKMENALNIATQKLPIPLSRAQSLDSFQMKI